MRNGRRALSLLEQRMMRRFMEFERVQRDLQAEQEAHHQEQVAYHKRFGQQMRGMRNDIVALFDAVASLDQELKDHKRDRRVHA